MLTNEFPPFGGGASTVTRILMDALKEDSSLAFDIVTSGAAREINVEQYADRVRVFRVPSKNPARMSFSNVELLRYAFGAFMLSKKLQRADPYDVCMAWSAVPAGYVAYRLKRKFGLPFILRIMGAEIPGYESRYRYLYPFLNPVVRRVWRSADHVIVKCEKESAMIHRADPGLPLLTIPNGIPRLVEKKWPEQQQPLRILCVGRLVERKRQIDLLKAMVVLQEKGVRAIADFIGDGYAEQEYRRFVWKAQLQSSVAIHGHVPREEMPQWYATADVFVLPSYNEGMSLAALEAMGAGLPLLITEEANSGSLVSIGDNGLLFKSGDVAMLAQHLLRLAGDRNLLRQMGRASEARAAAFPWDASAEKYRTLLQTYGKGSASSLSLGATSEKIAANAILSIPPKPALSREDLRPAAVGRSARDV